MSTFFRSSSSSLSLSLRGRRRRSSAPDQRPPLEPALYPYVWAMRSRRHLDAFAGLDEGAERDAVKRMARLPVDVREDLFLGDALAARDVPRLLELGITHVLNAAGAAAAPDAGAYAAAGVTGLSLEARDDSTYPMLDAHLEAAREFIAAGRAPGCKILVHCVQGLNRSGVLVAAEILLSERLPLLDVVGRVRARRGNDCLSNKYFQEQLARLAATEGLLGPAPGDPGCRVVEAAPDPPPPGADDARGASARASTRETQSVRDAGGKPRTLLGGALRRLRGKRA